MSQIKRVRGFQDIYGENSKKYRYVVDTARDIFQRYNFEEIILPVVEDVSLFLRSVGEDTDIVQKEMYTFEDRGGRQVALRPEGTAPTVRAFIEEKMFAQGGYKKLFYEGAMFRYERPQAGRYRQFHQIGAEILGTGSVLADVEMIKMVNDLLDTLGIETTLEINTLGSFEDRKEYIKQLKDYLKGVKDKLCKDCQVRMDRNPLRVLDCKNESCREATAEAPTLLQFLSPERKERFEKLKEYLSQLGIKYKVNPRLVRGLDYYTDTVFEFTTDKIGAQGTVAAGGRYDTLVKQLGGSDTPALGFAAGVERLMLLVDQLPSEKPTVVVIPISQQYEGKGLQTADILRKRGIKTELMLKEGSLKSKMKTAGKLGAKAVVFVSDRYEIKDMETGSQQEATSPEDMLGILGKVIT
ncbi:MAG: histidine--tRNA ligase [Aquificae bacterium]|nr:histidine--tRNA ligase [Aquificota bacterium]